MSAEKPRKSGDLKVIQAQAVGMDDASSQALSEALGSSFLLVRILVFVLIAAFVISCVFTVNPNEVAVVLRFGKPVGVGREMIKSQGLHFAFPYPIDEIVRIRNGEALTAMSRTSWYQVDPGEEIANKEPEPKERLNPAADGHLLMGDGNILHARAVLKYRIADPVAYTFQFLEASNLVTCALDNAIYRTAAAYRADEALYKDKAGFRSAVQDRLQEWISKSGLGISIDVLDVPVAAPGFVKQAFDFVIQSEQQQGSKVSQARGDFDRIVREAGGEAVDLARPRREPELAEDDLVRAEGVGLDGVAAGGEEGLRISQDRLNYWTGVGAQTSPTVDRLIKQAGKKSRLTQAAESRPRSETGRGVACLRNQELSPRLFLTLP